jgi:MFS family permease
VRVPEADQLRRDLRWNFGAALIDAAGWGLGMGLISATTILPAFVRELTPSPVAVGLIQAAMLFGWLVPGILVAGWVERLPRVKGPLMAIAMLERAMLLLACWACFAFGPRQHAALLWSFFACWFVLNSAVGTNMPGYYKLIAKTIPPELRGRLYGVGGAISGLLGVLSALLSRWLLEAFPFAQSYGLCFFGAFVVQTVTVLPLGFMREPIQEPRPAARKPSPWQAMGLAREDRRLLALCAAVGFFSLNQVAGGFYTVFAQDRFHSGPEDIARFTAVVMGSRAVAFLLVGWLGDHHGNRLTMQVSTISGIAAAAVAGWAPSVEWLYVAFALNELAAQGWGVCVMNYVLELCTPERSGTLYGGLRSPLRALPGGPPALRRGDRGRPRLRPRLRGGGRWRAAGDAGAGAGAGAAARRLTEAPGRGDAVEAG